MKALVTGGGGFLGEAIVRQLCARGDEVRVFSRGRHPKLDVLGVESAQGDLADPDAVRAACAGRDVVFHCAAKPPPWGRLLDYERTNILGTDHVIGGCRSQDVRALVYTSTPSVVAGDRNIEGGDEDLPYGTTFLSPYPATKAEAERRVLAAARGGDVHAVAIRPHLVYGPGDPHFLPRFIERRRAGKLRRIGDDDPLVDVTFVDDAAGAHLAAADRLLEGAPVSGRAYFVTSGEPVGVWTMVDRLLAAVGLPPVERRIPPGIARVGASAAEWWWRTFDRPGEPPITRFAVQQLLHAHWFSIARARAELRWAPGWTLDRGLEVVAAAYRQAGS